MEQGRILERLKEQRKVLDKAIKSLEEAIDIPKLSRGFVIQPIDPNNPIRLPQLMGRFKRVEKGKSDSKVYYFWDIKIERMHKYGKDMIRKFDTVVRRTKG